MGSTVATVLVGAYLFYKAEVGRNPKVTSFYDALVYCSPTNLSVGYSDIFREDRIREGDRHGAHDLRSSDGGQAPRRAGARRERARTRRGARRSCSRASTASRLCSEARGGG